MALHKKQNQEFSVWKKVQDAGKQLDELSTEELKELEKPIAIDEVFERIENWETLRKNAIESNHPKKGSIIEVVNIIQFVRLSMLDLAMIFNHIFPEKEGEIEQRLWYRIASMMVYEMIEDFSALLGKDARAAISELTNGDEEILKDLSFVHKQVSDLKREELTGRLKDVRIISIAHKDHDSKRVLDTMNSLSLNEVAVFITYMFAWNHEFETFLGKLVQRFQN